MHKHPLLSSLMQMRGLFLFRAEQNIEHEIDRREAFLLSLCHKEEARQAISAEGTRPTKRLSVSPQERQRETLVKQFRIYTVKMLFIPQTIILFVLCVSLKHFLRGDLFLHNCGGRFDAMHELNFYSLLTGEAPINFKTNVE
jgi:hypothetical protein